MQIPRQKKFNPSAARNSGPILNELKKVVCTSENRRLLEISSGSGQHVAHFAPHFPNVEFQPSECDPVYFSSILAYIKDCPTKNIFAPILIDITTPFTNWNFSPGFLNDNSQKEIDYILNINMLHISPLECSFGLFQNAGALLKPNGLLLTYGPYAVDGVLVPESNLDFDRELKKRDTRHGIRDIIDLTKIAMKFGIVLRNYEDLPANNKFVVWEKLDDPKTETMIPF